MPNNKQDMNDETTKLKLSRRGFMKSAGVVVGGAAITGALAGPLSESAKAATRHEAGTPSAASDINLNNVKPLQPVPLPSKFDYETDVLVIGWGVGGTMAALSASKVGAKVIALEKNTKEKWPEHAGVQVLAGVGGREWSQIKKQKWDAEDIKACADEMWAANNFQCDRGILERELEVFQSTLDMLHDIGIKFHAVDLSDSFNVSGQKYAPITYTCVGDDLQDFTPMDPWVNKYHAVERNIERVLTANGSTKVFYNAPVTNLVRDSSGRIVGAKATIDGKVKYVKAKATIIATGGYGANLDMCKYYGWILDFCGCHVGALSNNGDGLRLGQGAGAGLSCIPGSGVADGGVDILSAHQPWTYRQKTFFKDQTVSGYTTAVVQLARQPVLKVNGAGQRFMDENGTWLKKTMASYTQPNHYYYTIYDSDIEACINYIKGSRYGMCENLITPNFRIYFTDDDIRPLWKWQDSLEEGRKLGTIFTANTLEELAVKLGVNKENFVETVHNYNKYCEKGVDEEFGKHKSFLFPVKKPPFVGIKSKPSILWVTQGGLRVDTKWRVLVADGSREIPGLYAGSTDAGGMMKPFCQGAENYFQQASTALMSGRIAGENAALEALGKSKA